MAIVQEKPSQSIQVGVGQVSDSSKELKDKLDLLKDVVLDLQSRLSRNEKDTQDLKHTVSNFISIIKQQMHGILDRFTVPWDIKKDK